MYNGIALSMSVLKQPLFWVILEDRIYVSIYEFMMLTTKFPPHKPKHGLSNTVSCLPLSVKTKNEYPPDPFEVKLFIHS